MTDSYATSAQLYDLMSNDERMQPKADLAEALAGVDSAAGPVLEIGAGTGLTTAAIAELLPNARVVALEPSPAMRVALFSRLASRGDLRSRVTVIPAGIPSAVESALFPGAIAAAVAFNMIGHLSPDDRRFLWQLLAERLVAGAPTVLKLVPPERPEPQPLSRYGSVRVGDVEYELWSSATPIAADALEWTMIQRTVYAGQIIDEQTTISTFRTVSEADIASEVKEFGLSCTRGATDVVILRRGCLDARCRLNLAPAERIAPHVA